MPLNLVLPRPRISAQLYIAIVLTVAVLCGLAGLSIKFAGETIAVAQRIPTRGLEPIVLLARAEVLLEENRRLVDAAMLGAAAAAAAAQVQTYQANNAELARLLQRLGYAASAPLSRRFEVAAAQGDAVFGLARTASGEGAIAASRYATSSDDLRRRIGLERQQRINAAEAGLDRLGAKARVQIVWILAGAGIAGVLIGPLGLFLLRRVLKRIGAVGAALARLARNDTSVEIPDLAKWDEIGEFAARSPCSRPSRSSYCTSRPSWNGSTCNSTLPLTTCRSALACSTRKIACSCATRVTRAPNAAALVEAIIGLAGKLGMTTLAEGVESAQQLDWMRAHGCTEAQGFFFGAGGTGRQNRADARARRAPAGRLSFLQRNA